MSPPRLFLLTIGVAKPLTHIIHILLGQLHMCASTLQFLKTAICADNHHVHVVSPVITMTDMPEQVLFSRWLGQVKQGWLHGHDNQTWQEGPELDKLVKQLPQQQMHQFDPADHNFVKTN